MSFAGGSGWVYLISLIGYVGVNFCCLLDWNCEVCSDCYRRMGYEFGMNYCFRLYVADEGRHFWLEW